MGLTFYVSILSLRVLKSYAKRLILAGSFKEEGRKFDEDETRDDGMRLEFCKHAYRDV